MCHVSVIEGNLVGLHVQRQTGEKCAEVNAAKAVSRGPWFNHLQYGGGDFGIAAVCISTGERM